MPSPATFLPASAAAHGVSGPRVGRRRGRAPSPGRGRSPGRALCGALCGALLLLAGCGGEAAAPRGQPAGKVLVIGVDGLEWSVLRPLLAEGKCPNLRGLMERGSFGKLGTLEPTLSPIIWTTIATGRMPQAHGIRDFLDEQKREYTSSRRAVPALWNIADAWGLSSAVVGWWITWPVEHIRGTMVSGTSSGALVSVNWKPSLLPGAPDQVWPVELTDEVMAIATEAGSEERVKAIARERIYGEIPPGVLDEQQRALEQTTLWSMQSDATFAEIARTLFKQRPADLNLVYFGGTDVTSHRYWRQYRPEEFAWKGTPEADAALADVVPNYYEWTDALIGSVLESVPADTNVLVLSDHGFHAISTKKPPNEKGMTGHHKGAAGVLIAAGPAIVKSGGVELFLKTGALPTLRSVVDVAPTVLALLGIPCGRDMDGRPIVELLAPGPARDNAALPLVESHARGFRPPALDLMPEEMSESFQTRFGGLGYLEEAVPADQEARIINPDAAPPPATDEQH